MMKFFLKFILKAKLVSTVIFSFFSSAKEHNN